MTSDLHIETKIPFIEGYFYHVFNRSNNKEKIFYNDNNYKFFLRKFDKYLSEYLEVYAFCLLPTHFHFLVKVKGSKDLVGFENLQGLINRDDSNDNSEYLNLAGQEDLQGLINRDNSNYNSEYLNLAGQEDLQGLGINKTIIQSFSNFFNCYAKSINKQENRHGSLFEKHFKRKIIDKEDYLSRIIFYIHLNPVYHHLCQSFENYPWSSYTKILNNRQSKLKKKEVLEFFGGKENYIYFHNKIKRNFKEIDKYIIED